MMRGIARRAPMWLVLVLVLATPAAAGEISFVDMFRSGFSTQTGDGNSVSSAQFNFAAHLFSVNPGDFSAAELVHPGPGSPQSLPAENPTTFGFVSPLFATQALLDAAFPTGTYTYNATGTPSDTASFVYGADVYPTSQPFLTGTDFSDLQGMNPAAPFTFDFSAFAADPAANAQFIFFSIFDPITSATVIHFGFLPRTTTNVTVPADTLLPNHPYLWEIIFSNRVEVDSPGAVFLATLGFELRTHAAFETGDATAVPEPGSLMLLAFGLMSAVGHRVYRRARGKPSA